MPSSALSLLLQSVYIFFVYLFLYYFFIECQATCFKNSCYIFSKSGRYWYSNRNVCYLQGGYLVSIETEEEWHFINHEIQKRGTWNTSAWHIGLGKRDKGWTWESGEQLNISKWQDSQLDDNDDRAKYPRMEASLMVSLGVIKTPSFARCPEVRSHSNHKVYYVQSCTCVMKISLASSENIVHIIRSAHLTCTCEWRMNV